MSSHTIRVLTLILAVFGSAAGASPQDVATAVSRRPGRIQALAGASTSFNGTVSWSSTTVSAAVRNNSSVASGPMRLVLYVSSTGVYPASGNIVATYQFPSIPASTSLTVNGTWSISGGSGCYYNSVLLQEQIGSTWETDSDVNFLNMCSLTPNHGPAAGGNSVTVTGTNLTTTTRVSFDNVNGVLQSVSDKTVTVLAPAHAPGTINVRTHSNTGNSNSLSYTYDAAPPKITGLSPSSGPVAGGNPVTITGTGLNTVTTVRFGSKTAPISSKTATQIVAVAPANAAGEVNVVVESPSGSDSAKYRYEGLTPIVSGIAPDKGPTTGGQTVRITGQNLAEVTSVSFGGAVAAITSKSATQLVVVTPARPAGVVTVSVRAAAGSDSTRYTYQDAAGELRMLPVAGSLAGNFGSFFRTALQMNNPGDASMSGKVVFHPQGQTASPADPSMPYVLQPGETKYFADVVQTMSISGLGSLDLQASPGSDAPNSLVRIYNDGGSQGTTGMTIDFGTAADALSAGSSAVLVAPPDLTAFRFNVGIRTLAEGVSMNVVVRDANGTIVRTNPVQFGASSLLQFGGSTIAGGELTPNTTLTFQVTAGSAMVYGATTDNVTQDPSYQIAAAVPQIGSEQVVVPVTGSAAGNFNSFFRTAMQMHNPLSSPVRIRIVYHPQAQAAGASDPNATYTLAPGETRYFADIVQTLGATGLGSMDVIPLDASMPVLVTRVYNDAGTKGTTGMTLDAFTSEKALRAGDRAILIAPPDATSFRYNLGVRSLGAPTSMTLTLRNATGVVRKTIQFDYPANFFRHFGAADAFGMGIGPSDTISVSIVSGSAIVYGATTDNQTQDPNVQIARP